MKTNSYSLPVIRVTLLIQMHLRTRIEQCPFLHAEKIVNMIISDGTIIHYKCAFPFEQGKKSLEG